MSIRSLSCNLPDLYFDVLSRISEPSTMDNKKEVGLSLIMVWCLFLKVEGEFVKRHPVIQKLSKTSI